MGWTLNQVILGWIGGELFGLIGDMNFEDFEKNVAEDLAPDDRLGAALQALFWDAKGDWDRAHALCQGDGDMAGDWVHAYLHRKEGDLSNARYWYSRCGKPEFNGSLDEEWAAMARTLLEEA